MLMVHQLSLYVHILLGIVALVAFWLPVASRKGSHFHRQAGKLFAVCMWTIAISGIIMCTIVWIDPIAIRFPKQSIAPEKIGQLIQRHRFMSEFLMLLSILVLVSVKHATLVLKARDNRQRLKSWHHLSLNSALGIMAVIVLQTGLASNFHLYTIFGGIGLLASAGNFHYIFKPQLKQREWVIEHMSSMIGAGIGVYTAFFAVGGRHILNELLTGNWLLIPWTVPSIIGTLAIVIYKKKYEKQFRVQQPA